MSLRGIDGYVKQTEDIDDLRKKNDDRQGNENDCGPLPSLTQELYEISRKKFKKIPKNPKININRARPVFKFNGYKDKQVKKAIFRILSRLAESISQEKVDGDEEWDMHALMRRTFDKRPLHTCKFKYEREKVILLIDTSGSCANYKKLFAGIAEACTHFELCDIYTASNAHIQEKYEDGGYKNAEGYDKACNSDEDFLNWMLDLLRGRTVLFFGDFDGGYYLNEFSKVCKLFWFSMEFREDDYVYFDDGDRNIGGFNAFLGHYVHIGRDSIPALLKALRQFRFIEVFSREQNKRRHLARNA